MNDVVTDSDSERHFRGLICINGPLEWLKISSSHYAAAERRKKCPSLPEFSQANSETLADDLVLHGTVVYDPIGIDREEPIMFFEPPIQLYLRCFGQHRSFFVWNPWWRSSLLPKISFFQKSPFVGLLKQWELRRELPYKAAHLAPFFSGGTFLRFFPNIWKLCWKLFLVLSRAQCSAYNEACSQSCAQKLLS